MKTLFFICLNFLVFSSEGFANTGCVMNYNMPTERVFTTLSGTAGSNYPNYINGIENSLSGSQTCPKYDYYSAYIVYRGTPAMPVRCCINRTCDISYVLVAYQTIECPIDNNAIALVLSITGLACFNLLKYRSRELSEHKIGSFRIINNHIIFILNMMKFKIL